LSDDHVKYFLFANDCIVYTKLLKTLHIKRKKN
jgi:hypothetical protein